ncbi:histidinol-phosphatase [Desulfomicrobium escambiense]|uniref:histidinol-phosphatase n=1 Tax=Desulfomicrobium escambiense TaxID=29503 RepID=UPI000685241E|nr:histidinol-phosphatase [Desulfomicrobium escambiense]
MQRISLHGGHSGQFCDHARDTLAEIVAAYHAAGFECVGLTEHMPPLSDAWLYPDEVELGRTAVWMQERFGRYVAEARRLEREYAGRMRILVGMESEWYPGCGEWVARLRREHELDYVVGSVHHVGGQCFDFSKEAYADTADRLGGLEPMYLAYFDSQLTMMQTIKPELVGHLDLIRLHDPNYPDTLAKPEVWRRIMRNLVYVREIGAVMDMNARALLKGQAEPYVCGSILQAASGMGICFAYGDDAHGHCEVGFGFERVDALLFGVGEMSIKSCEV